MCGSTKTRRMYVYTRHDVEREWGKEREEGGWRGMNPALLFSHFSDFSSRGGGKEENSRVWWRRSRGVARGGSAWWWARYKGKREKLSGSFLSRLSLIVFEEPPVKDMEQIVIKKLPPHLHGEAPKMIQFFYRLRDELSKRTKKNCIQELSKRGTYLRGHVVWHWTYGIWGID